MANINIILDSRRAKQDGTYNIIFRVTYQRQVYTINSGISIYENQWNVEKLQVDKSHPNYKLLNLRLSKDYFKTQEALLQLGNDFTIESLRSLIDGKPLAQTESFKAFADKLILQMNESGKIGNSLVYQTATNSLIDYAGEKITFKQIDYELLERFTNHLTLKGLKQNSIHNYFRTIRAIYNKAIKHKIVDRSFYPFHDISVKSEATIKRAISKEDIIKLVNSPVVPNTPIWRAKNDFLLSFYLVGISFTDLAYLKPENLVDGRILYRRKKTGKNYSIKLFPQAESILLTYTGNNSNHLLPILLKDVPENSLRAKRIIMQWIKTTNKYLKRLSVECGLSISITTYSSRHSFGTIAKRLGYSNELIAEALGHEYGNRITNIYLDSFDKSVVDDMHKNVIKSIG